MDKRVVVTGLGMVTPIGNDVESSWKAAKAGTSGVGLIDYFDTEEYSVKICAGIKWHDVACHHEKPVICEDEPGNYIC